MRVSASHSGGVQALGEGAMPNLTSLRLRGNSIGDMGMEALAQSLMRATAMEIPLRLQEIRISGNPASERSQEAVQAATGATVFWGDA